MSRIVVLMGHMDPTPANRSVFELFRWLGRRPDPSEVPIEIEVVSLDDGERRIELSAAVPLFVVSEKWAPRRLLPSTLQKLHLHRLGALVRAAELRRHFARPIDAAYLADLDAVHLLRWLPSSIPVIGHLHRVAADRLAELPEEDRRELRARVPRWIAGDAYARDRLEQHLGIDPSSVPLHDDFIRPAALWSRPPDAFPGAWREHTRGQLHDLVGIPVDVPLVCGRGVTDFWFETESFVRMCWEVRQARPDTHFLWVSETSTTKMVWPLLHDLDLAGLDCAHLVRAQLSARACVAASDVFVRSSRHIGSPGTVEEAAALGTPTVRFRADDRSPGLGGQTVVDWPDLDALVDGVLDRLDDPTTTARRSEPARWDVRVGGPLLLARLQDWVR